MRMGEWTGCSGPSVTHHIALPRHIVIIATLCRCCIKYSMKYRNHVNERGKTNQLRRFLAHRPMLSVSLADHPSSGPHQLVVLQFCRGSHEISLTSPQSRPCFARFRGQVERRCPTDASDMVHLQVSGDAKIPADPSHHHHHPSMHLQTPMPMLRSMLRAPFAACPHASFERPITFMFPRSLPSCRCSGTYKVRI
ncbi:hypothetical protein M426DRAFT_208214 [Hypoxylon sp. CI-4A]|nr:hypothetical protein M426DRAFT_208214 [Hypoxylon sp. CI-4A]